MPRANCTGWDKDNKKARDFSNTAEEVLVFGRIPESAVVATVSLAHLQMADLALIPKWMRDPPPAWVSWPTSFRSYIQHGSTMLQSQSLEDQELSALTLTVFIVIQWRGPIRIKDWVALAFHLIARPYGARPHTAALEMV
jgi:hypothetical protein